MELKDTLQVYFLVQGLVLFWFFSPLKSSLISILTKDKYFSSNDFDVWLMSKSKYLGKFFSCHFCFTFWSSMIISFLLIHSSLLDIITSMSVSITLNYLVLKFIENK